MPRQPNPNALTNAERSARSRANRQVRTLDLPASAIAHAEFVQREGCDASLTAAIVRVLREAAERAEGQLARCA